MIAHLVLFRPREALSADARRELAEAFVTALNEIPSVRRARLGTRLTHGRAYEDLMTIDYQYSAILEFDDLPGLRAYLEHPAHAVLGERFLAGTGSLLVYDFDLREGRDFVTALVRA